LLWSGGNKSNRVTRHCREPQDKRTAPDKRTVLYLEECRKRIAPGLREIAERARLPVQEWPWNAAARRAGLKKDAVYLVRPDGHIGFARKTLDLDALRTFWPGSASSGGEGWSTA
jgi:hypothetical protein